MTLMFALDAYNYIIGSMLDKEKIQVVPPEMSHQYPEARCFERTFVFDPETQARALRFMISYYGLARRIAETHPEQGAELIQSLAVLTDFFVGKFPEVMEEEVKIDSECGGGIYHREQRLANFVLKIISEKK